MAAALLVTAIFQTMVHFGPPAGIVAILVTVGILLLGASSTGSTGFHFLRPAWLLLVIPAVAPLLVGLRRRDPLRSLSRIIDRSLLEHLVVRPDGGRRFGPAHLLTVAVLVLTLSAAGPAWRREPAPFAEETAAVVIALEVTPEMLAEDVPPTRLERATQKISDILEARPDARVALVAFAGSAHLVMPLTRDHEIIAFFAGELTPPVMPVEGERTAEAVALAGSLLQKSGQPGSILLVTDGVPPGEEGQLAELRDDGLVPVHILALAAPAGTPVPARSPPAPPLDRDALDRVARGLGGSVTVVTPDERDVKRVAERLETRFGATTSEGGERWRDEGYALVPVGLLLALFWFRRGWVAARV